MVTQVYIIPKLSDKLYLLNFKVIKVYVNNFFLLTYQLFIKVFAVEGFF